MESVNTEKEDEVKTCENNLDDLISVVEVVEQLVKDTVENKAAENQNDIESMNVVVDQNDNGKSDDHEVSSSAIFVQQNEAIKEEDGVLPSEADVADDLNAKVDDSEVSTGSESVKDSTDITVDHEQSKQEPPKEEQITTEVILHRSDNEKVDDSEVTAEVIAIHQTESVEMQIKALSVEEDIAKDQRQFVEDAEISKEEKHNETDVIADDQDCKEEIVVVEDPAKNTSAEVPLVQQNATVTNEEHPSTATASTSTSSTIVNSFDSIFDDFLQKYLETEPSKLDDHEIRAFSIQIPRDYVVPEDRFQTIFKVLFKIKDLQNKAVYNDSLALIEKVYSNLDYNKFLFDFWSCDQFKDRELGPIGYSFTEGRHRYDFGDVQQYDSDITLKNSKAVEAAWSMLLDVKATVNELLNDCIKERSLHSFLSIILRRFKCLGDYKIKIDGKETPIFLYFYEKAHDYAIAIGYLPVILSYLVSVTWTPKNGKHRWALMQPNYSLCKIMELILREDENQPKYLTALQRLFNPFDFKLEYFECDIEWNSESEDFDNPSIFLFNLMKYFNRKNSLEFNNDIFNIIDCFKKSLHQAKAEITNFEMIEGNSDIDWPFSYCILDKLEARNVKRYISESIFKALPPTFGDKCISMNETETSLKTALIEIMELYFLCRSARPIPDAFFKNLFSTYGYPKSVIDEIANAIFEAYKNLKKTIEIKVDIKFIDFLSRICEFSLDSKIFEQFSCMVEMNTDLIHQSIHLVIAGRVLRLIVDEKFSNDNKKPSMNDLDAFFQDLFKAFTIKVHNKFGEISTMTHGVWPPWRKGTSPSMSDEISMGINHILNAIQKEAFCIFDIVYGRKDEIIDFLFYLYKQRRYFGFTFSKLDAIIRSTFASYFENLEAAIDQKAQHQNHIRNNTCSENRPLNREYSQPQTVRQHRFEQQQQQTSYPSQSRNHQSSGYSGYTNGFETHPMQQNNTQRNNGNIRDGRPFNRSNDSGLQRSRGGNY